MSIYYLIIFGLCSLAAYSNNVDIVEGAAVSKNDNAITKNILMPTSLPFEDCGSKYFILYVNISSCSSIPCVMYRGTTVDVHVVFDDDGDNISYLKHQVRWIFNAVKTYANIAPDPCDGVQQCLTNDNDGKSYFATVLVNNTLPGISGTMLWEAMDKYNRDVICFKVPVVIAK